MTIALALDVYGTLIHTSGIAQALRPSAGERALAFARSWREKQLEYSFRRALMQNYRDFSVCTRQALEYTASLFQVSLTPEQKDTLMDTYRHLPAFPDAVSGLKALKELPVRIFAFSNGRGDDIESLLSTAGIRDDFEDVISLSGAQTFKPNPAAYAYFYRCAKIGSAESWLVSSNPFDVIGGVSCGMQSAWVKRSPEAIFDPWEIEPTITVGSLDELAGYLKDRAGF